MEKITGSVQHYVYKNEQNGYAIAKIETSEGNKETIVGYFPLLAIDVVYDFHGTWIKHPSYGNQFKVESFHQSKEQSIEGLINYLSSNYFTGIGPKTATKIVNSLGNNAIERIIEDKTLLLQVGLNEKKMELLYQQLIDNKVNEHILVTLYGYQISGKTAMKLLNYYQMQVLQVLEANPYQLIEDIDGIGFLKADEIALKMSISKDDKRRVKAAILYALKTIGYQNGDVYLTETQVFDYAKTVLGNEISIQEALSELIAENKVNIEDQKYYLAISLFTEKTLAKDINDFTKREDESKNTDLLETLLDVTSLQKQITYTDMQKRAILESLNQPISIITGGPGTGKTTIIDGILDVYAKYHKLNLKERDTQSKIALMAPTGRAAKRMKELLGFDAKTIHSHLGFGYDGEFAYDEFNPLPHQLIIIDEASMIDLFLAKRLFSAISKKASIIIVGDVDQLPSVGPGQVLKDLIDSHQIHTIYLDQIHRQASDSSIIRIAQKVNHKDVAYEDLYSQQDVYFYRCYQEQMKQVIIQQIDGALKQGYDLIEDIQVLIPMYKGDIGIDSMNVALQERFNANKQIQMTYQDKKYYVGDKVIQLVNDPKRMIMNGDIGVIKKIDYNESNELFMVVAFDDNEVMYEKNDLEELNLAYAMSIHKSQGSEYKIVVIPLIKGYMHMLKKELIYTAITRAKQYLIFLGDINLLVYAANHLSEKRQTTLKYYIEQYHKKEGDV